MWYRYCRLIIAGKEHIIKKIIGYFAEKGIGRIDLDYLQYNLNTLDKNNLLPPIIELRKDGVFFDDTLYEDFFKFKKVVNELYEGYEFRQKTKEQKKLQKNETAFVPGKISVFPCNNVNDAIKYGNGTSWCISEPGNGNYDSYRSNYQSTFYYIKDGSRQSDDPLSRVMVDIQANGNVSLTDINNTTGTIAEFGEDWRKYFEYLKKNGVDISQFVSKPLTQEEKEENNFIGKKIDYLDQFKELPLEYKFKYIGRGYLLTTDQLLYILKLNTYSKNTLINAYLNTGRCLPEMQKIILLEGNPQWKTTYVRRREIEIDQIRKHFENDDTKIRNYASDFEDDELTNITNLYESPLRFANIDIYVENLEQFNILLNKGVELYQFDWDEISEIDNLPEDFLIKFADYVDWKTICKNKELSEDFIRKFADKMDWNDISERLILSEDFIREFQNKVNWETISYTQELSEDFIREFQNKVDWVYISMHQKLSEDFIREFEDRVNWEEIFFNQTLSEDFIRKLANKIEEHNWSTISQHQTLSEDFIREFKDKVDWKFISREQTLSEDFIREFQGEVDWLDISINQKLTEDFIREFQDKVDWYYISYRQKLSENFIRAFQDKVNWHLISEYQTLSEDFIREFQDKVNRYRIKSNKNISDETKHNLKAQGFRI